MSRESVNITNLINIEEATATRKELISFIKDNFTLEEIFETDDLEEWASDHGFKKIEE